MLELFYTETFEHNCLQYKYVAKTFIFVILIRYLNSRLLVDLMLTDSKLLVPLLCSILVLHTLVLHINLPLFYDNYLT